MKVPEYLFELYVEPMRGWKLRLFIVFLFNLSCYDSSRILNTPCIFAAVNMGSNLIL